jgi:hypothetical protein
MWMLVMLPTFRRRIPHHYEDRSARFMSLYVYITLTNITEYYTSNIHTSTLKMEAPPKYWKHHPHPNDVKTPVTKLISIINHLESLKPVN